MNPSYNLADLIVVLSLVLLFACANLYYDIFHEGRVSLTYANRRKWLTSDKLGSSEGSNRRRRMTVLASVFSFAIYVYAFSESFGVGEFTSTQKPSFFGYLFVALSLAYFAYVIVLMVLRYSQDFPTNSLRLIHNTAVSAGFNIAAFSILYLFNGIKSGSKCIDTIALPESMYFSAVTFSTLGYGDYSPCEASRAWAALEAIVGNVHLGVFVAALFSVLGRTDGS